MREFYFLLGENRQTAMPVSRRRWRRWMKKWRDEFGYFVIIGNAVTVGYYYRGRSGIGIHPPLVWRTEMHPAQTMTWNSDLRMYITERWNPDALGIHFSEIRDLPFEGLARGAYFGMCRRAEQLLNDYADRGGSLPPDTGSNDEGEEWKRG